MLKIIIFMLTDICFVHLRCHHLDRTNC